MTPTLTGRWQTRLLLFSTIGILVSLPFCLGYIGAQSGLIYLWILGYITVLGVVWDIVYIYLQKFRWDRDWPGIFQLFAGIWEGGFFIIVAKTLNLPGVPRETFNLGLFILHYSTVWIAVYTLSQTGIRVLFPKARFRGGRWF